MDNVISILMASSITTTSLIKHMNISGTSMLMSMLKMELLRNLFFNPGEKL